MTIRRKLTILTLSVIALAAVGVFAITQVSKGARFHHYNYLHTKYADDFANYLDSVAAGGAVLDAGRAAGFVHDIRAQPVACLDEITLLDRAILWMSGNLSIIRTCRADIALADKTLEDLDVFQRGLLGRDALMSRLQEAADGFIENSEAFGPVVRNVVDLIGTIVMGLMLATGAAVAFWVNRFARRLSRSLLALRDALTPLAGGDYELEVPAKDRSDELGEMARAIDHLKEAGKEARRLEAEKKADEERRKAEEEARRKEHEAEQERQRAAEREEMEAKAAREQRMAELARDFDARVNEALGAVGGETDQLRATAQSMHEIAARTADESQTVADAAEEASSNVDSVAAANEELSQSITEVARQASNALEVAQAAVDSAGKTDTAFKDLTQKADAIGEVVDLIRDIADQTNLLALNATIEAARAGEAGKGFAVVANEVKSLAGQTAKATDQIGEQVGGVQESARTAVEAIREIDGYIEKMNETMTAIAQSIDEHRAATEEIGRNMESAATGTGKVSEIVAGTKKAATQGDEAAREVVSAIDTLTEQSDALRREIAAFLETVKTV